MSDDRALHSKLMDIWTNLAGPLRTEVARDYVWFRARDASSTWADAMKPALQKHGLYPPDPLDDTEYNEIMAAEELIEELIK